MQIWENDMKKKSAMCYTWSHLRWIPNPCSCRWFQKPPTFQTSSQGGPCFRPRSLTSSLPLCSIFLLVPALCSGRRTSMWAWHHLLGLTLAHKRPVWQDLHVKGQTRGEMLGMMNSRFPRQSSLNNESVRLWLQAHPHIPVRLHTQVRLTNYLCNK